jgi:hypothetical protein
MKSGFYSLPEASAQFAMFVENIEIAEQVTLAEIAILVRDEAKSALGIDLASHLSFRKIGQKLILISDCSSGLNTIHTRDTQPMLDLVCEDAARS